MNAALHAWLFAWLFALGISLGSAANLMVHALTGGRWGEAPRAAWRSAARLLPLLAVGFLPIALGLGSIYPWVDAPGPWLNRGFFLARAAAYFAIWIVLSRAFLRTGSPRIAAGGLVVHAFVTTLAAYDWIASLTPEWRSSGFGLVVGTGQMLAGMAYGVAVAAFRREADEQQLHDLGNLLLMYVLTWAYLAYTEFLIIWAADLPKEIAWYVTRLQGGWAALGIFLVAFHFAVPFAILLSRAAKRSPRVLGSIAAALLVAHLADVAWLVLPSIRIAAHG